LFADAGQSGIVYFRADVTVQTDAIVAVREEITVQDAAKFYKVGFMRNLPVSSGDRWDVRYVGTLKQDSGVRVQIVDVTDNGKRVKYRLRGDNGFAQILIGEERVPLDSGEHDYVIRYTAESAVKLGTGRDTLYWNALGHDRNVPVAEAILAVHLPAAVSSSNVDADSSVGGRGASLPRLPETTLDRLDGPDGTIIYRATNVAPRQSLSVAVTWPSGYLHRSLRSFFPRGSWIFGAPGLLFFFYLIAWIRIGPEPKKGTIVTRYEPPKDLSPAGARYIATGTSDGRSFAAVIAQLAIRGCIRVEPLNGKYKLSRLMSDQATEAALAPEEKRVLDLLFSDGPEIELSAAMDERNVAKNGLYISVIHQELTQQLGNKYLNRHIGVIVLGVGATFVSALLLAATATGRNTQGAMFFTMWILFCGLSIGLLTEVSAIAVWKNNLRVRNGWIKLLPGVAAIGIFVAAIVFMLTKLAAGVSLFFAITLVAFLVINLAWPPFLKRKTALGREVTNQIAGFRQFLQTVQQDRLNRIDPTESEELDNYLPYAIALEVKEAWGDHLAGAFIPAMVVMEQ
jgi:hypothetical protein